MRVFCILMGLIISASGLLALMAHPNQLLPNATWIAGMCLFYSGAFALKRKTRRVFAGRR
jgi:hypothetical protein